jgi:hypothetical protein
MGAVWVEAEHDREGGGVVLSLKSVKSRRLLKEKYGRHTVRTSVDRVRDFPTSKIGELRKGWPVQFKMNSSTYLQLLGVGADVAEALGALGLGRWKNYHSGDRIRITAPSKHFGGKPITVEGVVYNANNYGTEDDPNWRIEFDMFATEFAEAGPQKWEQKKHGGTVEILQMAQDLSIPPPPNPQMSLPGVSGLFGDALDGMRLQVVPAYGRDYKSKKAVVEDWNAGKDFVIADMSSQWDTKPVNRQDAVGAGVTDLQVRYSRLMKIAVLKLDSTGGAK